MRTPSLTFRININTVLYMNCILIISSTFDSDNCSRVVKCRRNSCLCEINEWLTNHLFNDNHTKGSYCTGENVRDRPRPCNKILLPVKFRWLLFSGFRGEVENVSANQRPGRPTCFSDQFEKHKLGRGRWDLASWQVSLNSVQRFRRSSRKCLNQSEARAAILFVPIGPKNTNLVEDIEILLAIKFCWILFSGFRGEVENVPANQRPGRPSCFSDRPEKDKLGRGCWVFVSGQVSLNSVKQFQRRSRKCEKLTRDGRTTDRQTAWRQTTLDHNSALEPLVQVL